MKLKLSDLEAVANKFVADNTTTLAASLAFYTALSIGPLLIIFVTITSYFSPSLQQSFLQEAQALTGPEGAMALNMIITSAKARSDLSGFAGFLGVSTLLISSGLIFGELRFALNRIFHSETSPDSEQSYFAIIFAYIKEIILRIGLAFVFLLLLTLTLYAASFKIGFSFITVLFSFFIMLAFFSSMFRYMPHPRVPWPQAWRGGMLTSVLFILGREVIRVYLVKSAVGSAYGAAGSVVVLMVWIYYSSLIILLGAQVSSIMMEPVKKKVENVQK